MNIAPGRSIRKYEKSSPPIDGGGLTTLSSPTIVPATPRISFAASAALTVGGTPYWYSSVPVAPYATFGSEELAAGVVAALDGRYATLMANHGQIVAAPTLNMALLIAEEIEEQAAVYYGCLAIGGPNLLTDEQMAEIMTKFRSYGQKP